MKVFNTLSGRKEEFLPQDNEVKMYVCGVTPYSDCHLGHALSYVIFDVIRRYIQFRGYKVKYVQNITDVDDKIIDRANQLGISTQDLAEKYIKSYFDDMDDLNIVRADIYPRATQEIAKIIEIIQGLVGKGYAYPAKGSVYFRVRSVPDYGKLSHRTLESMTTTDGAIGGEDKEHPMDFVLWKAAKHGEPSWDSPWGGGRPGWHTECSAMSLKYLGSTFDIHGGGQDLIFPHHENEIAQSESFTGVKPVVKFWLHNGMVRIGTEKMSKSLGNLITIKEALQKYSADAIRIFILNSHYRSPLTYSEEALEAAERGVARLRQTVRRELGEKEPTGEVVVETNKKRFIEAMDDDFNTAQAVAVMFDLAHDINRLREVGYGVALAQQALVDMANVLGLTLKEQEKLQVTPKTAPIFAKKLKNISVMNVALVNSALDEPNRIGEKDSLSIHEAVKEVERTRKDITEKIKSAAEAPILYSSFVANVDAQVELRAQLREARQFQLADDIRAKLGELDIVLEDTPTETKWRYKR